jgi:opacity protein-like surface antigen
MTLKAPSVRRGFFRFWTLRNLKICTYTFSRFDTWPRVRVTLSAEEPPMSLNNKIISCASACFLAGSASVAQAENWEFEGNFYLFAAETTTGIGDQETTLSFGDALENLDVAFMAALSASKGRWSFIADYMLTDLSFESGTPGPDYSGAQVSVKTQIFTGVGLYNVHDVGNMKFDVGGGLRWFKTDTTLRLRPGNSPGVSRGEDDDWIDPILAARARFDIAENWTGTAVVDWGGFVDDRETWQVLLTANWEFSENWIARFGYRYISVENDEDGQNYSFEQSGPVVGISYRF